MANNTVKYVVISLAVSLLLIGAAAAAAETAPNEPLRQTEQSKNSIFSREPNFAFGTDKQFDTGGFYWRMVLATLIVLVLGTAAYYVSKRLGGKISNIPGRQIKLVETLYLGSRKALHLIKVGNRSIIVGTTPTTITRVAELGSDSRDSSTLNASE